MFEENGQIQDMPWLQKAFPQNSAVPVSGWKTFISKRIFVEPALEAYFWNLLKKYPEAVLRLEVEEENGRAVKVYEKNGFNVLPYMEMKNCYNQRSPRRILQYLLHSFLPAFQV